MEQSIEENAGLFRFLPLELQINIFCYSAVTDLVFLSSTCQYWRLNAWAFIVTLDPTEFQLLVKKIANHASFDPNMVLDLFSDAVAPSTIDNQPNNFKVFNFLFERIEQSIVHVDRFTIDGSLDGWSDIKIDLFDALEKYPGFMKQLKQLKLVHLSQLDLIRVLDMARSLEVLDLKIHSNSNSQLVINTFENRLDNLTSLTLRDGNYDEVRMDDNFPTTLRSLKFESGSLRYIHPVSLFPNLTYLGFVDMHLMYKYNNVPTYHKSWPNLKVFDVTGTGTIDPSHHSIEKLPKYLRMVIRKIKERRPDFPHLEVWPLADPNDDEAEEGELHYFTMTGVMCNEQIRLVQMPSS